MNVRRIGWLALSAALAAGSSIPCPVRADTLLYSTGFESSDGFTLNSALPSSPSSSTDWYRIDGNIPATTPPIVDINSTNNGGSQGLRVANQGPNVDQSNLDSNTFVESPVINVLGSSNLIANNTAYASIKWDMRVVDASNANDNSVYFGLDVYDAVGNPILTVAREGGASPQLIGTGSTGDFNPTPLGNAPATMQWASYELKLDYVDQLYRLFVNGIAIGTAQPFTSGAEDSMDIDLVDAGRGLDSAYFDNFSVSVVPEPASAALVGAGLLAGLLRRRRTA